LSDAPGLCGQRPGPAVVAPKPVPTFCIPRPAGKNDPAPRPLVVGDLAGAVHWCNALGLLTPNEVQPAAQAAGASVHGPAKTGKRGVPTGHRSPNLARSLASTRLDQEPRGLFNGDGSALEILFRDHRRSIRTLRDVGRPSCAARIPASRPRVPAGPRSVSEPLGGCRRKKSSSMIPTLR